MNDIQDKVLSLIEVDEGEIGGEQKRV